MLVLFNSLTFYLRNLQQNSRRKIYTAKAPTPYIGRRRYRTQRSAICALCFAEMTLVRARKRKIGKRHKVRKYSRKATAYGPNRPEASSTKATKRLASSIPAAPRKGRNLDFVHTMLNGKRLSRKARGQEGVG